MGIYVLHQRAKVHLSFAKLINQLYEPRQRTAKAVESPYDEGSPGYETLKCGIEAGAIETAPGLPVIMVYAVASCLFQCL